jgi:cytochrome c5
MTNQDEYVSPNTIQPMVIIFGLVLAFTVVVSLIVAKPAGDDVLPAVANSDANIKPLASVEVSANSGPHVDKSGVEVVKAVCSACHATGMLNAPKIGDKAQWAPRIAQGYATLVKHALEGIRSMPAHGGNPDLSDVEIAGAVADMANQAGAKFDPAKLSKK